MRNESGLLKGYLGLGSNVGDREANLRAAIAELIRHGIKVVARSSVYETEPVGEVLEQPDFLNAAVRFEAQMEPAELLAACKETELALGRDPDAPRHSPRPVDVDILVLDGRTLNEDRLAVPHPALRERRFVLVPLLELDPGLVLPDGTPLSDLLAALPEGQRVDDVGSL